MTPSDVPVAPHPPGIRFCASCLAIYRQDFQRCPVDGATLVVGANDPWIGRTVGTHYSIDCFIGQGAMGRVYRAHHREFRDRRYAVKILLGDLAASAQQRARFVLEAEHASRLSHPNIVGVIDFGSTDHGMNYIVMDLVEGPSIGEILRSGPIAPERVIGIARQIALGLEHAHGRGMIHRDLKPDNVLVVSERGNEIARIADFGLSLSTHNVARLTTTGVVCTPAYASPEQLRGETIDHRVDLYALGTTMFEMLSGGALPFEGDVDTTVRNKLAKEPPSIVMVAPDVPPALVSIVSRLLSPIPERRPGSARAVVRALDQALSAPRVAIKSDDTARLRVPPRPPQAAPYSSMHDKTVRPSRRRRIAIQLSACALTLAGVFAWLDMRGTSSVRADSVGVDAASSTLAGFREPAPIVESQARLPRAPGRVLVVPPRPAVVVPAELVLQSAPQSIPIVTLADHAPRNVPGKRSAKRTVAVRRPPARIVKKPAPPPEPASAPPQESPASPPEPPPPADIVEPTQPSTPAAPEPALLEPYPDEL